MKKKIDLLAEFNPALLKYEPILPLNKSNKEVKIKIDWKWIAIGIIILLIFAAVYYLLL